MKIRMATILLAALAVAPMARAQDADVGVGLDLSIPGAGDYDLFDTGFGVEALFRRWCNAPWGYQLSAGFTAWDAGDGEKVGSHLTDFSGDALGIPFGVSGLYQLPELPVALELGVRYVLMGSDIEAFNTDAQETTDVDVDDGVVGVVAVQTDWPLSERCILGLDAGYHFDLVRGDVDTDFGSPGEAELESFFLRAALRFPL